jgi:predicted RNA-binding Zn ribbon-like protein
VSSGILRHMESVARQPHTGPDTTPPAPGDLELVRAFLSVHDHLAGTSDSLAPGLDTIAWWLGQRGLIDPDVEPDRADLRLAADVLEALRSRVRENMGAQRDPDTIRILDDAAHATGLAVRFGAEGLAPTTEGVRGALGRILAIAFLSEVEGTWSRFKMCSSPVCRSVFWDRSKNRSGRWCTMKSCGNRAKVRAYREREHAGT